MLKIDRLTVEGLTEGCVTDRAQPRFSFSLDSDRKGCALKRAEFTVNGNKIPAAGQLNVKYDGAPLSPFTRYTVRVKAEDEQGECAEAETAFETGRMGEAWQGKFITDGNYRFTEKRVSPRPMTFKKTLALQKKVKSARLYVTALGILELTLDGQKVGADYFAPGFTSYEHTLQYFTYDVTDRVRDGAVLRAVVAGGWAVGSFVFTRKNRITAPRQALLAELRVVYEDGSQAVIGTDESWLVTMNGRYLAADFYDGETYDASKDEDAADWHAAAAEKVRINPDITAAYGAPVRAREKLTPVSCKRTGDKLIYDFGQNFAGVISAKIKRAKAGQRITFKHAEILKSDGTLYTELLRSAKAAAVYVCAEGEQSYSPRLTYMGFRYVSVEGIAEEDIELTALALYSDIEHVGSFACSNEMLNKLQSNIIWSAKSNFMDIPTDCPQRDERMGWTGDIALFSPTACYNFDMSRFLDKWLTDVKDEQLKSGGIPNTVPVQGYGFPATMPVMAVDFWGDACILVPYAEYMARGDKELLRKLYPTMKKYVKACKFWANFLSLGKRRYIWNTPAVFHFGDWVCPDLPKMSQWQARRTWTATASLANTSSLLSEIAGILGEKEDEAYYKKLSSKVKDAYESVLTDGAGRLKKEFQTGYVLPLYYDMFRPENRQAAADNLAELVRKNDYKIGTGFPGTPYILFALADNGHADQALKMLLCDKCPSWLYEVKAGGTTIWERWDGLKEDGTLNSGEGDGTGGMISFNHYASGAVGDFLYRRIGGLQPTLPGYKRFSVKPLIGGGITRAETSTRTPYGIAACEWKIENGKFTVKVRVPVGAKCDLTTPDGQSRTLESGSYEFSCGAKELE